MQLSSESPEESDVTYTPDTAGPSERLPSCSSWGSGSDRFDVVVSVFRCGFGGVFTRLSHPYLT